MLRRARDWWPATHSQSVGVARCWPARLGRTGVATERGGAPRFCALKGSQWPPHYRTGIRHWSSSKHAHWWCGISGSLIYRCTTIRYSPNLGRSCIITAQIARLLSIINSRGGSPCVLSPPGLDPALHVRERSTLCEGGMCWPNAWGKNSVIRIVHLGALMHVHIAF